MEASKELIDKLKEFEGFRSKAYLCPAGVWTIGYGHTFGVRCGDIVTEESAEEFLRSDLEKIYPVVRKCRDDFSQHQFDALCSFVFNLGVGNFECSTLYKVLRRDKDSEEVGKQIRRWVYCNGKVLAGLTKRREWEARYYYE
jgi:lysozyme